MATIVTGEIYESIDGKLFEIKRQLRQKEGYPFNPNLLNLALQELIEGRFPPGLKPSLEEIFVQMIANGTMIVHRGVKVNRNLTPQQAIIATGRKQYVTDSVLATMPRGEGDVVDLYYVKRGRFTSDDDCEKYLKELSLVSDPYAQAADNEANPGFADDHPNGTHWKDAKGEWCFSAFDHWGGGRGVGVDRHGNDWDDRWWFPGSQVVL